MVPALGSDNFRQAAGWLIGGQRVALWWQAAASGDTHSRGLWEPLVLFPPTGAMGAAVASPWSWLVPGGSWLPLPRRADPFCPPLPQEAYNAVVRYFGESLKTTPPSVFFPVFVRFIRSYKVSRREVFKEESASEKLGRGREGWASSLGLFHLLL